MQPSNHGVTPPATQWVLHNPNTLPHRPVPGVVVLLVAPDVEHAIDGAAPSHHLATVPETLTVLATQARPAVSPEVLSYGLLY